MVGLEERAHHRGYELSGGEQLRVALARALVKNASLLLADQPTGQLDSETAQSVMGLLRSVAEEGATILVATHDEAFAEIADRILTIEGWPCHPGYIGVALGCATPVSTTASACKRATARRCPSEGLQIRL